MKFYECRFCAFNDRKYTDESRTLSMHKEDTRDCINNRTNNNNDENYVVKEIMRTPSSMEFCLH